jgi:hypothetical protein
MKEPERQPERRISTVLSALPEMLSPPPNRARFETDVAARPHRAALRLAVVHTPEVLLKISTVLERPELSPPPPNRARFETDVAARQHRATLRL